LDKDSPTTASTATDGGTSSAKAEMKVASDLRYGEWLPLEAEADLSSAADEDGVINESDLMDSLPDKEEKTITVRLKPPVAIRKRSEELPKGVRIRRHAQI